MDEDMDIEAMLDAPLKESRKNKEVSPPAVKESKESKESKEKEDKSHKKSKKHKRSRSRSKKRKHKSRSRSRSKERRHKSSRDRRRSRSGSRSRRTGSAHAGSVKKPSESHHRSSREHGRSGGRGGGGGGGGRRSSRSRSGSMHWRFKEGEEQVKLPDPGRFSRTPPRPRDGDVEIPPEERDKRTVFCMQLHTRLRARDLEEFFSQVGRVRDVRIISDRNSRRCKGIAYIEFFEEESVAPALKLTGTKIMGIPIQVQHTQLTHHQAEKNRAAMLANMAKEMGPTRLYVGSLHFNITEQMLRAIFEPFGYIDTLQLMIDPETNRSKGYGFVQYRDAESARRARDQLNGFELAGRPIKVGEVTEQMEKNQNSILDDEETDRGGIEMNANARIQLMAKLASGNEAQKKKKAGEMSESDLQNKVREMFGSSGNAQAAPIGQSQTECFVLSNMFDPSNETEADWADDIRSDVIAECASFGGAVHVSVDKNSADGNVYVKAPTTSVAMACVNSLQGRWFSGKMIKAAYLTVPDYSRKFAGTEHLRRKLER